MKEVTYGWYPSANDVYKSKWRPTTSHLECLYQHNDSMYHLGKMTAPEPELMVMGVSASGIKTPLDQKCMRSKSIPVPKFKPVPKLHIPTPTDCWNNPTHKVLNETVWGVIGESPRSGLHKDINNWPMPAKKSQLGQQQPVWKQHLTPQQQQVLQQQHIKNQQFKCLTERQPLPQYAWGFKKAQSPQSHSRPHSPNAELKWPSTQKPSFKRPQSSFSQRSSSPQSVRLQKPRPASSPVHSANQLKSRCQPTPPPGKQELNSKRPSRIQSATVHREKTPLPTRPQTASPRKQELTLRPPSSCKQSVPSRPVAPAPFIYDVNNTTCPDVLDGDALEGLDMKDEVIDEDEYDQIVKKYGWRAEVHGDPYKLKKILPRMSYAVTCQEPGVPPEPPGIHMETNEPFFYNTIPNKPMSFDVDKEWISEVITAKRLELQKREGGIKYSYKNFSFVY